MSDRSLPGKHETPAEASRRGWVAAGLVVVIGLGFAGCIALTSMGGDDDYDMNNEYEAVSQCEARVEKLLKAPSTAQFDSSATGSGTWTVTGTVDAENSFGASVRSSYGCTVVMNNDEGTATTTVDYFE